MSQTELKGIPEPSRMGPFTSGVSVTMKLAQHEASERGQSVRPIYLLLAAARMEKEASGYICEQVGITPQVIASYLDAKGEKKAFSPDNRIGFTPQTMLILDAAAESVKRWGHTIIDSYHLTSALAESDDEEVQAIFALCGTTGPSTLEVLHKRMREKGLYPRQP